MQGFKIFHNDINHLLEPHLQITHIGLNNLSDFQIIESVHVEHYIQNDIYSVYFEFKDIDIDLFELNESQLTVFNGGATFESHQIQDILNLLGKIHALDPLPIQFLEAVDSRIPTLKVSQQLMCYFEQKFTELLKNHNHLEALEIALNSNDLNILAYLANRYRMSRNIVMHNFLVILHQELNEQNFNHERVKQFALNCDDSQIINLLTNFYQIKQNFPMYIDCLQSVPETHPDFIKINELLYNELLEAEQRGEIIPNLNELKLRSLLNIEESNFSGRVFDEMCGIVDIKPRVESFRADAATLARIATIERELYRELHELRKFKADILAQQRVSAYESEIQQERIFPQQAAINEEDMLSSNLHRLSFFTDISSSSLDNSSSIDAVQQDTVQSNVVEEKSM